MSLPNSCLYSLMNSSSASSDIFIVHAVWHADFCKSMTPEVAWEANNRRMRYSAFQI
jgi:hypothetical protein